mmetsp:Transcript_33316/g.99197  ORF Transcript_33316/g.99197 Transcript_33316/m.99197 type:complete len:303 (+) Transcript_33316:519-1427(+)
MRFERLDHLGRRHTYHTHLAAVTPHPNVAVQVSHALDLLVPGYADALALGHVGLPAAVVVRPAVHRTVGGASPHHAARVSVTTRLGRRHQDAVDLLVVVVARHQRAAVGRPQLHLEVHTASDDVVAAWSGRHARDLALVSGKAFGLERLGVDVIHHDGAGIGIVAGAHPHVISNDGDRVHRVAEEARWEEYVIPARGRAPALDAISARAGVQHIPRQTHTLGLAGILVSKLVHSGPAKCTCRHTTSRGRLFAAHSEARADAPTPFPPPSGARGQARAPLGMPAPVVAVTATAGCCNTLVGCA